MPRRGRNSYRFPSRSPSRSTRRSAVFLGTSPWLREARFLLLNAQNDSIIGNPTARRMAEASAARLEGTPAGDPGLRGFDAARSSWAADAQDGALSCAGDGSHLARMCLD